MRSSVFSSAALGLLAYVAPAAAFWRMPCPGRLITERADPIVNPGGISGHVHQIAGGNGFDFTMDYESTQKSTCSSCPIKQDLSNYWTPNLYYMHQDGTFEMVPQSGDGEGILGGMTVYYLQRGGPNNDNLTAFPEGFRMLAGNPTKRAYTDDFAGQAVSFVCLDYSGTSSYYSHLPNVTCPDGLRAQIFFPSCWDGVNLDSANHESHMAYPTEYSYDNGPCPASHPVHTISIFYEVIFSTAGFDWWVPEEGWQPFVFSMGDPTGYGFHGDFVNGWNVTLLQEATNTCTNLSGIPADCPLFEFYTNDESSACILAPTIDEQVDGIMDQLPGCNPVQYTYAPVTNCTSNSTIGEPKAYYTNFTGWTYEGCGLDNGSNRTFNSDNWWSNSVTIEGCLDYCGSRGYTYAGLEYSTQCFCGNTLAADRAPVEGVLGNCFSTCAGNSSEYCGGANRLSIYSNNGTFVPVEAGVSKSVSCPYSNGTNWSNNNSTFTIECGLDRGGGDFAMTWVNNGIVDCMNVCSATKGCTDVSLSGTACYMKSGTPRAASANSGVIGARLISQNVTSSSTTSSLKSTATTLSTSAKSSSSSSVIKSVTSSTTSSVSSSITSSVSSTRTTSPVTSSITSSVSSSSTTSPVSSSTTASTTSTGAASATAISANGNNYVVYFSADTNWGSYTNTQATKNYTECMTACDSATGGCTAWTYVGGTSGIGSGTCWLKTKYGTSVAANAYHVSGNNTGKAVTSAKDQNFTSSSSSVVSSATASSSSSIVPTNNNVVSTSSDTSSHSPSTSSVVKSSSSASSSQISSSSTTASSSAIPTSTSASCPSSNGTYYVDPTSNTKFLIECGIDHAGGDLSMTYVNNLADCVSACATTSGCVDVSLSGAACYMKSKVGTALSNNPGIQGAKLVASPSTSSSIATPTAAASTAAASSAQVTSGPPIAQS